MSNSPQPSIERLRQAIEQIHQAVSGTVLGQEAAIDSLCAAYLAGGHVLLEGVPGVGKTLLARCFAATLGLDFTRLQFTPDLMPGDVLGTNVFDRNQGTFRLVRGPVFTQVLMADEVNRTPPKTQAALLEAMQEHQATIDGVSYPLGDGFFVIATQNPLEHEGVYPLPEAQLDRFLLRIEMTLPPAESELEIYRRAVSGELAIWGTDRGLPETVVGPLEAVALRSACRSVHASEELLDYLQRLAQAVRDSPHVELGPSPRGALALLEAGRGAALLAGREFLVPDDLKGLMSACWSHRLLLTAESELEGFSPKRVLEEAADSVAVPH
ncbi:MAG: MoxR family ATPase [Acidobacteriota bacterium]|nr:MoxR family ATPase [Acidobacteriota bacterium]